MVITFPSHVYILVSFCNLSGNRSPVGEREVPNYPSEIFLHQTEQNVVQGEQVTGKSSKRLSKLLLRGNFFRARAIKANQYVDRIFNGGNCNVTTFAILLTGAHFIFQNFCSNSTC